MTWDGRWPMAGRPTGAECEDCAEAQRHCYCSERLRAVVLAARADHGDDRCFCRDQPCDGCE